MSSITQRQPFSNLDNTKIPPSSESLSSEQGQLDKEKKTDTVNDLTKLKDSYKKSPTSLGEEFLIYQNAAAEASEKGNQKLADRWNLTAHLILKFVQYLNSSNQVSFIIELAERVSINDRAIEAQEIAQYTTSSLAALMNNDVTLAQKLIGYAQETKEVGVRYRHWFALIKQEIASHNVLKELTFDEATIQYRANALKATKAGQEMIAQHWSEAACLTQEASRKKGLSLASYVTSGNEMLSTYWELSRDASYDAAKIKAEVALALEQGNKVLAQKYDDLALLAEKLSSYRENLVRSIINGEITITTHWRSASCFLSKSLEAARSLSTSPANNELFLSYQKNIITTAEQAAESHSELIPKLQKKKIPSLISIAFAEQSYEEAVKALQSFQEGNLPAATISKKRVALYNEAYQFSKKAAEAKSKWCTLGISFLYWKHQVKKVESLLRSC